MAMAIGEPKRNANCGSPTPSSITFAFSSGRTVIVTCSRNRQQRNERADADALDRVMWAGNLHRVTAVEEKTQ